MNKKTTISLSATELRHVIDALRDHEDTPEPLRLKALNWELRLDEDEEKNAWPNGYTTMSSIL